MFSLNNNQNKPPATGLFGSTLNTNSQPTGGGIFGGLGQNTQQSQQPGGLFSQSTQQSQPQTGGIFGTSQSQPQQTGGIFGGLGQNTQQNNQPNQQSGGLFGGLGQNTQPGGLFGQSTQQKPGVFGSSFGQSTQPQQTGSSLFGSGQNNQQQQQNSSLFGGSTQAPFGQSTQQQFPVLGQSQALWQPQSGFNPREKSIPEQISTVLEKWDTNNPNCAFKYYFYNKVDDNMVPYYRPGPNEDPKAWEDALSKKPGPGFIPVLCTGFREMGERIKLQQQNLAKFNAKLHEINSSLSQMMQNHETQTSIRAMDARRKHLLLKRRCLALATKVQVIRNRGYALGGDEEDLRSKLMALEKNINDPGLGARGEEIWTRMVQVQKHAEILKNEIEKSSTDSPEMLDEEMTRRAKKILEDYNTQLGHLKAEIDRIQKDYADWEKDQGTPVPKAQERKIVSQGYTPRFV